MTMKEAMEKRHTVRKYTDRPIPEELIRQLRGRIAEHNEKYELGIALRVNDTAAFSAVIKLVLAKGVRNYLVLSGPDTKDLDEKLGFWGGDLMLYAQTLGLNTWWVGGTFQRAKLNKWAKGNRVIGVIAIGYGAAQGVPHKSKSQGEVSSYEGETPDWFQAGVKAALLAPTALNQQAFFITGKDDRVKITCSNGIFTGADLGLVKYHFALGAGTEGFQWENG